MFAGTAWQADEVVILVHLLEVEVETLRGSVHAVLASSVARKVINLTHDAALSILMLS